MKKRILYIDPSEQVFGGQSALLNILENLDRSEYEPIVMVPKTGQLSAELKKLDIKIIFQLPDRKNKLTTIFETVKAFYFLRKNKISIIHFNYNTYWKPPIVMAARILKIPIISHVHFPSYNSFFDGWINYSNILISPSNAITEEIMTFKKKTDMVTIHYGVDIEKINKGKQIRKKISIPENSFVVGFVGEISPRKGIIYLINAAKEVTKKYKNIIFLIIGGEKKRGKYLNYIKHKINNSGLKKQFIFTGKKEKPWDYYKTMNLFVLSSLKEALPMTLCEAAAAGLPLISTNINGIPEIVKDGYNGYLVEPKNSTQLAEKIEKLIKNRRLAKKMGENGRKLVSKEFDIKKQVKKIEAVYEELLNKN